MPFDPPEWTERESTMTLRKNSFIQEFLTQRRISGARFWRRWWSRDRESLARLGNIAFVIVLAAGVRLLGLNQIGFNTDEAVYSGQAAAIAQVPVLKDIFPIFRAHPLLFQFLLALLFNFGLSDLAARLLAVAVGVLTVYFFYPLWRLLFREKLGIPAAMI